MIQSVNLFSFSYINWSFHCLLWKLLSALTATFKRLSNRGLNTFELKSTLWFNWYCVRKLKASKSPKNYVSSTKLKLWIKINSVEWALKVISSTSNTFLSRLSHFFAKFLHSSHFRPYGRKFTKLWYNSFNFKPCFCLKRASQRLKF